MRAYAKACCVAGLALGLGAESARAADYHYRPVPAMAPGSIWTGFYIGANGGFGGNVFNYPFALNYADPAAPVAESISGAARINSSGFLGGVQGGYNWQFYGPFVAGVEGDLDFAAINGKLNLNAATSAGSTFPGSANASLGSQTQFIDTVRLRLGYLVSYQFLLYGTGGWAYGQTVSTASGNLNIPGLINAGASASRTLSRSGWTLGVGSEYKLNKNWSFKAEYLYVDLGEATLLSGGGAGLLSPTDAFNYNVKVRTTDNLMRVGLNYTFN